MDKVKELQSQQGWSDKTLMKIILQWVEEIELEDDLLQFLEEEAEANDDSDDDMDDEDLEFDDDMGDADFGDDDPT